MHLLRALPSEPGQQLGLDTEHGGAITSAQVRAGGRIPKGLVREILQCVDKAGRALTHTHTIPTKGAKGRGAGRRRRGYTKGQ